MSKVTAHQRFDRVTSFLRLNLGAFSATLFFAFPSGASSTILTQQSLETLAAQRDALISSAELNGWTLSAHGNHLPSQLHGHSAECMALAVSLGLQTHTSDLNDALLRTVDQGLKSIDPDKQSWIALWVVIFFEFLGRDVTDENREAMWDLSCAGQTVTTAFEYSIKIPDDARIATGLRSGFAEYDQMRRTINILGEVTEGYAGRIEAALASFPQAQSIGLGSGGGNVGEAVRAGQLVREAGLKTELIAKCESACPLVFLGGVERIIWHPPSEVGFHMLSVDMINPLPEGHEGYDLVRDFVYSMGANGESYVSWMLRARPETFFIPPVEQLCEANIVTWAQTTCTGAEVVPPNQQHTKLVESSLKFCWLTSPIARITNVSEYVNLRRQADFSAPVVRQVPLGEGVRAQRADNITIIGQERDRQSCINACQAFGRYADDRAARDRAQQCINDNMLWYEITDARGNRGWVSRKFLDEEQQ